MKPQRVFTSIEMEWTDTGAVVKSSIPIHCPRCSESCAPGSEHRCGDQVQSVKESGPAGSTAKKRARSIPKKRDLK